MLRPALLRPLLILIVIGIGLGVVLIVWAPPPPLPGDRAIADMRSCERRVGIPSPLEPDYQIRREARYGAYVGCMVNLGYTSKDMP